MAQLSLGQTVSVREAVIEVALPLEPGTYVARLVVEGPSGRSRPAEITIVVERPLRPVPPIRPPLPPIPPLPPTPPIPRPPR